MKKNRKSQFDLSDALIITGFGAFSYGVYAGFGLPIALIISGCLVMVTGIFAGIRG